MFWASAQIRVPALPVAYREHRKRENFGSRTRRLLSGERISTVQCFFPRQRSVEKNSSGPQHVGGSDRQSQLESRSRDPAPRPVALVVLDNEKVQVRQHIANLQYT